MTSVSSLPVFAPYSYSSDAPSAGPRWRIWTKKFENLIVAMNISDTKQKRALLLHYIGDELYGIFDTLSDTGDDSDYQTAIDKLTEYLNPKRNMDYEIYVFRQAKQQQGENIDIFHTRLRKLATTCEFGNVDKEIKSQIIMNCNSTRLRRRALRESDMTLAKLIESARALEISESQATGMEQNTKTQDNAYAVRHKNAYEKHTSLRQGKRTNRSQSMRKQLSRTCYFCGGTYPHKESCPAEGKQCTSCNKMGHFARVCKSRPINRRRDTNKQRVCEVSNLTDIDQDGYVFSVNKRLQNKQPYVTVSICDHPIRFIVDSGASINLIDEQSYLAMNNKPRLWKSKTKVYAYGSTKALPIIGEFIASLESKDKFTTATMHVVKGKNGSLLSYETSSELNLIKFVNTLQSNQTDDEVSRIVRSHEELFHGIGHVKNVQVKLHIDENVPPVAQPHRRIPYHMRKKVETEIKRLEQLDIIEKATGATPWISPIVVVPKPRDPENIRLCIDMRQANTAIKRERHVMPTIDDIIHDLNNATVFSKLDLTAGYHQLELSPESRYITAFSSHIGLWRYKRLNFGITSAAEIFQDTIRQMLNGIPGVINLSDDILIHGHDQQSHNKTLHSVLKRIKDAGITLNRKKCQFNKDSIDFFGYVFSKDGISPDPRKVEAIDKANTPQTPAEVRSWLGMTNYCSRFIRDYATLSAPLRELTHKDKTWIWEKSHQDAFEVMKERLTQATKMAYFDPTKETEIIVDAGPSGLGAILTQKAPNDSVQTIAYAGKMLTDVEQRYSQIEREALAIVYGCQKFHMYVCGSKFKVITDHKPLEYLWNNPKSKQPVRLERLSLKLQPYDVVIEYRTGKENPADYLSRHNRNMQSNATNEVSDIEEYVNFITNHAVPKSISLEDVKQSTRIDKTLQKVIEFVRTGGWFEIDKKDNHSEIDIPTIKSYKCVRNQLTVTNDGLLLKDNNLIIPKELQMQVINIAHEGHQGIVKTKMLLREKVWFPDIDKKVEERIQSCIPCLASTPGYKYEPLKMSKLPDYPFQKVSVDFCGPFPSGDYLLVIMDEHSRFPIVHIVNSTSGKSTIPQLDQVFATFGIPEIVKTDNGPPFNGEEFRQFSHYLGFKHQKITPLWPRGNAEVERFMKTLRKTILASHASNQNWKQQLFVFLRNYRATPHISTKVSPASLMYQYQFRTKLPEFRKTNTNTNLQTQDRKAKEQMKLYGDNHLMLRRESDKIKENDVVLVKQPRENKLTTPFNSKPYKVVKVKGSMITAEQPGHTITRNSSHYKKVKGFKSVYVDDNKDPEMDNCFSGESQLDVPDVNADTMDVLPSRPVRVRVPPRYLKDYIT